MSVPAEEMARRRVPVAQPAVQQLALPPPVQQAPAALGTPPPTTVPPSGNTVMVDSAGRASVSNIQPRAPASGGGMADFGGQAGRAARAANAATGLPGGATIAPGSTVYVAPDGAARAGAQLGEAGQRARAAAQAGPTRAAAAALGTPPPAAAAPAATMSAAPAPAAQPTTMAGRARAALNQPVNVRGLARGAAGLARRLPVIDIASQAAFGDPEVDAAITNEAGSGLEAATRVVGSRFGSALTLGAMSPRDIDQGMRAITDSLSRGRTDAFASLPGAIEGIRGVPQNDRGWGTNLLMNLTGTEGAGPRAPTANMPTDATVAAAGQPGGGQPPGGAPPVTVIEPGSNTMPPTTRGPSPGERNTFTFSDGRTVDVNSYRSPAVVGQADAYTGAAAQLGATPARGGGRSGGGQGAVIGMPGSSTIERIDRAISDIGPLDRRGRRAAVAELLGLRDRVEQGGADREQRGNTAAAEIDQRSASAQLAADVDREQIAASTANARRQTQQLVTGADGTTYAVNGTTLTPLTTGDGQPFRAATKQDSSLNELAAKLLADSGGMMTPAQAATSARELQANMNAPAGFTYAGTTPDGRPQYRDAQGRIIQPE